MWCERCWLDEWWRFCLWCNLELSGYEIIIFLCYLFCVVFIGSIVVLVGLICDGRRECKIGCGVKRDDLIGGCRFLVLGMIRWSGVYYVLVFWIWCVD